MRTSREILHRYHSPIVSPSLRSLAIEPLEPRVFLTASLSLHGAQSVLPAAIVNASDEPAAHQSEMSIVVNPTNPLNIVGFSHHHVHNTGSLDRIDVYYSTDGGGSWSTTAIDDSVEGLELGVGRRFDPTITFDAQGRLFIGYGFKELLTENTTVVIARSDDGGETFTLFKGIDGPSAFLDKWFITSGLDPENAIDAVYITYTTGLEIIVRGSNDGWNTWTSPFVVGASTTFLQQFPCPAVGVNGDLLISWYDVSQHELYFDRDPDGLWGPQGFSANDIPIRTLSNGSLYRTNARVPAQPNRGLVTGPVLAVDRSGHYDGRLYLTFIEWKNPRPDPPNPSDPTHNDSDVMFGYSDDDGATWNFEKIDDSPGTEFHAWIDVDQATGSVHILYYTTEGDQNDGNDDVHMRLATSLNGGAPLPTGSSWTLSDVTSITSNPSHGYVDDYREYIGLDVHHGTAHGLFSFQPSIGATDLEALYVNAAFVSEDNTLTITGDDNGSTNDTIVVRRTAVNSDYLEVFVNNERQFTGRYDTIGKIIIDGGDGMDTITLQDLDNTSGPEVTVTGGAGDDILNVNTDNAGVAIVRLTGSETFSEINIGTGGGVVLDDAGNLVLRTQSLSIASGGFLDLANNRMIIDYDGTSPLAMVQALLTSGYAGGAWTGNGIRSSSAAGETDTGIGYAESSDLFTSFPGTFGGWRLATAPCSCATPGTATPIWTGRSISLTSTDWRPILGSPAVTGPRVTLIMT